MILTVVLILFNLAIATWNAYAVGRARAEMAIHGHRPAGLEAWALNAAKWTSILCFTIPLAILTLSIAQAFLSAEYRSAFTKIAGGLLYFAIVPPITALCIIITFYSVREAFRPDASLLERGIAVYNTAASIHNVVELASTMPKMFDLIGEGFKAAGSVASSGEGEEAPILWGLGAGIALFMIAASAIVIATCGGAYVTHLIERWGAGHAVAEVGATRQVRRDARSEPTFRRKS
jgi:hypothetical protein